MKEPGFAKAYEEVQPELNVIRAMIEARTSQNLTQKQLAEMCGISESAINRIENGKRQPSFEVLQKMSKALGCSVDHLLTGRSGLILRKTDEPDIEINYIEDGEGNVIGEEVNLNTMLTGNEERDQEVINLLEDFRTRPDMRMLFKVAHGATEEDVRQAVKIIEALRRE